MHQLYTIRLIVGNIEVASSDDISIIHIIPIMIGLISFHTPLQHVLLYRSQSSKEPRQSAVRCMLGLFI